MGSYLKQMNQICKFDDVGQLRENFLTPHDVWVEIRVGSGRKVFGKFDGTEPVVQGVIEYLKSLGVE